MNKVYCVMDGPYYPEGCPLGIFDTLVKSKKFIETLATPEDHLIFEFNVNSMDIGYIYCYNYLGVLQSEAPLD